MGVRNPPIIPYSISETDVPEAILFAGTGLKLLSFTVNEIRSEKVLPTVSSNSTVTS